MTQAQKRAIWTLSIWGIVTITFLVLFFTGGGAATFDQDRTRFLSIAILFASGFISYFIMMYFTRATPGEKPLITDERDEQISRKASSAALVAVLTFIYALCISLFVAYEDQGNLPVGWMWFLAYINIFFGHLSHAVATLILNAGARSYGER